MHSSLLLSGGGNGKITPGVDLTHSFYTDEEKNEDKATLYKKYGLTNDYMVWAIAMPWSEESLKEEHINKRYMRLCGQVQSLINKYSEYQHVFIPFYDGTDIVMIHDLIDRMEINSRVIPHDDSIGEKRLLFKFAKQAVVMRFHGVQFALFYGTPFIAISYSPKTTNIMDYLGLGDLYVEFGIHSSSGFMREFDIAGGDWEQWEEKLGTRTDEIKKASEKLKEIASEQKEMLLQWIYS